MSTFPRPWSDPAALELEIREVLGAGGVDYRHLHLFLGRLWTCLIHLQALGELFPAEAFRLARALVNGIGDVSNDVHVDENELGDFAEDVVEVALGLARDEPCPGLDREALLLDLVQLRKADRDGAFEFVPGFLARLDLGDPERERLTSALGRSVEDG